MDFQIVSVGEAGIVVRHVIEFHEWSFPIGERDGRTVLLFEAEAGENPLAACSARLLQQEAYGFAHRELRRQGMIEA